MTESGGVGDRVRESPLDPLPVSLGPKPSHCAEHDLQAKPLPGRDLAGGSGHPKPHPYLSRWIKFEEKVEEGGERWSKPHVSTLSLHSLFELRTCLQTGTVLLDLDSGSLPQIIGEAGTAVGPPNWGSIPPPCPHFVPTFGLCDMPTSDTRLILRRLGFGFSALKAVSQLLPVSVPCRGKEQPLKCHPAM